MEPQAVFEFVGDRVEGLVEFGKALAVDGVALVVDGLRREALFIVEDGVHACRGETVEVAFAAVVAVLLHAFVVEFLLERFPYAEEHLSHIICCHNIFCSKKLIYNRIT